MPLTGRMSQRQASASASGLCKYKPQHSRMANHKASSNVLCGLPGDLWHADDANCCTYAKIGGEPIFPGSSPPGEFLVCRICGKTLSLVVQAPAAKDSYKCQERILMLWACTAQSCIQDPAAWRATSCMLPCATDIAKLNAVTTTERVSSAATNRSALDWTSTSSDKLGECNTNADSWGSAADDWGSPSVDAPSNISAPSPHSVFDYKDLEQALDSCQQSDKLQHSEKGKQPACVSGLESQSVASCSRDLNGSELPGFYLIMVSEAAALRADMSAEDQHIAELLAAYESADQEAGPAQQSVDTSTEDQWTGEAYEADVEGALLKFQQHLQQRPQQCLRYSMKGTPIWPNKPIPDGGKCKHCGTENQFEMQILPPLMHYLEETCSWLMDDGSYGSHQVNNAMQALSAWQWLTIAVFGCPRHCLLESTSRRNEQCCILQEEVVVVANEQ